MLGHHAPPRLETERRPTRALGLLAGTGLAAAIILAACGGSSSATPSLRQRECTTVANVLSDGPDPSADPVGYAEAQVLPLEQTKLSDAGLRTAVAQLDTAYRQFSANNGANSASYAVKVSVAEKALNKICPGAAP